MGKMRGTRSMGHGPGKTSMRTGGGNRTLRNARGKGMPSQNRSLGAMSDSSPSRRAANAGTFPAVYGGARKVSGVKLTGPQAGMTEITR